MFSNGVRNCKELLQKCLLCDACFEQLLIAAFILLEHTMTDYDNPHLWPQPTET
jgi:hypothetical protein